LHARLARCPPPFVIHHSLFPSKKLPLTRRPSVLQYHYLNRVHSPPGRTFLLVATRRGFCCTGYHYTMPLPLLPTLLTPVSR
jgi:hypothetical protein